jgi:hypothetical protein
MLRQAGEGDLVLTHANRVQNRRRDHSAEATLPFRTE